MEAGLFDDITVLDLFIALGGSSFFALLFKVINKLVDDKLARMKQEREKGEKEAAFLKHMKTDKSIYILLDNFRRTNGLKRVLVTNTVDSGALLTPLSKKYVSVSAESAQDKDEIKERFQDFPLKQYYANLMLEAKQTNDVVFVDVQAVADDTQRGLYQSAGINYEYLVYIKLTTRYDGKELVYCLHSHVDTRLEKEEHIKHKASLIVLANELRALL